MNQQKKSSVFYFSINLILFLFQTSPSHSQTPRPNILIILADDMKWNSISLLNPDNILQTPNIDRIGLEGANIKYYSTNSLCEPGRTSLLSGKYGHTTAALNNNGYMPDSILLLPEILHDNGYYTALCGKWMITQPGPYLTYFDYWLSSAEKVNYYNDTCQYYNTQVVSTEHITDFLTDSAVALISKMDTPFFMMLNHNAPHREWFCQTQYDSLFTNDNFKIPENFSPYSNNYPSFLYDNNFHLITSSSDEEYKLRRYYRMMAGIEESVGEVLNELEVKGLLDNTMVIFTTDNSFLIGEHSLMEKQQPYDECMRMPLLIRYPPMFQSGTVLNDNFILNIDLAPTILSLAGIADTFDSEGFPIQDFVSGQRSRLEFLYEQKPTIADSLPNERTFRDTKFQYNRYYCTDTTEELFDMMLDPFQKINLVNDTAHFYVLHQYRLKLDSIRLALNDTANVSLCDCYLKNKNYTNDILADMEDTVTAVVDLYPNPGENYLFLNSNFAEQTKIDLYNIIGKKLKSFAVDFTHSDLQKISIAEISAGVYFLNIRYDNKYLVVKFVKY
ncbi:MAG: sulfatase-like hydrolase/transferase [Bacteroidota bacterium]